MINRDRTDLSLTKQCKLLKISRSPLYYKPVGMNDDTLTLMNEIDRVFTKYSFFGSRQIAAYLPRNGFHAGRHRVRRLMQIMGLQAIYKGPSTSKKHPSTRFTLTCLGSCRSRGQTTFGAVTLPTFRSGAASSIWSQSVGWQGCLHPEKHGLGHAQGAGMAALEHAGRQLLY